VLGIHLATLHIHRQEEFEDPKGIIRIRKLKKDRQHNGQKKDRQHNGQKKDRQHNGQKKDRQHNGQKKKDKRTTKHTHKTKDRVTRTH
jgi:hypothetical protein